KRAMRELDLQPRRHVLRAQRKPARRRAVAAKFIPLVERFLRTKAAQGPRKTRVRPGAIVRAEAVRAVARCILHPAGAQDARANEILPAFARDLLDELACDSVEDIVIGIGRAETRPRLEIGDALDRLFARQMGSRH